jgi:hypothetical protein
VNPGDDGFTEFVRTRGDHHLRIAVLLTGDWHAGEDLAQASLVKLYRAWTRLDTDTGLDAYLHRIMINTHRSWWRARWRREVPTADLPGRGYGEVLAALRSVGQVREIGPASGPGWTGTQYAFSAMLPHPPGWRLRGTVDVDHQGRVRAIQAKVPLKFWGAGPGVDGFGQVVAGHYLWIGRIAFGDFGVAVQVTAPPASQIFTPPSPPSLRKP